MLKHDEMIENVHRRIAQYEEEKKMKHSKFNKIISAIKPKSDSVKNKEDDFTESVSGTETVGSSNRIVRTVSSIAAAAVLVTGIGTTGFLLHKNKPQHSAMSKDEVSLIQVTEETEATRATEADPDMISPFCDFNKIYFSISELNKQYYDYSSDTYDKIAKYLNAFKWGKGIGINAEEVPDIDTYTGKGYAIGWKKGDKYFNVYVLEDGKAYYVEKQCVIREFSFDYPIIESSVFDIDYKTFDKYIQDIFSKDVPYTDEKLSPRDIKELSEGEFLRAELSSEKDNHPEIITPKTEQSQRALQDFLGYDFVYLLSKEKAIPSDDDKSVYTVERYFKSSETSTRRETYYIQSNGVVSFYPYELVGDDAIPTDCRQFCIDINEFETKLKDILDGKYDEKYRENSSDKTEKETTAQKPEKVQPATVNEVPEEPQDNPPEVNEPSGETEANADSPEKDLVRAFYAFMHDGSYGEYNSSVYENGKWVDYKDEANIVFHNAEKISDDRVLGTIADEEDAISKGREILIKLIGQEKIDYHEREYIEYKGTQHKLTWDEPPYKAEYYEEYDIWYFSTVLRHGKTDVGINLGPGPDQKPRYLYIRGCDGKVLAAYVYC